MVYYVILFRKTKQKNMGFWLFMRFGKSCWPQKKFQLFGFLSQVKIFTLIYDHMHYAWNILEIMVGSILYILFVKLRILKQKNRIWDYVYMTSWLYGEAVASCAIIDLLGLGRVSVFCFFYFFYSRFHLIHRSPFSFISLSFHHHLNNPFCVLFNCFTRYVKIASYILNPI